MKQYVCLILLFNTWAEELLYRFKLEVFVLSWLAVI